MKWQWLIVCLVVGLVLVGCGAKREVPAQTKQVIAPTPEAALTKVDSAIAKLEEALGGQDVDAVRRAIMTLTKELGGLASHISTADLEAAQAAQEAGQRPPEALMDKLGPAIDAADRALSAVIPPKNDVAAAAQALIEIKKGVDAVR